MLFHLLLFFFFFRAVLCSKFLNSIPELSVLRSRFLPFFYKGVKTIKQKPLQIPPQKKQIYFRFYGYSKIPQRTEVYQRSFVCVCVRYLGEGVLWEVLVGEVTGLDQLAGDRGVWRVRGLPIGA